MADAAAARATATTTTATATAAAPLATSVDAAARDFTVVAIPCSAADEMREVVVRQPANGALEAMLHFAREHFAREGLPAAGAARLRDELRAKAPGAANDDLLNRALSMTMCDVVPLVPNTREFGHVAVNLVVDDKAVSKGLPVNARATSLARACGLSVEIRGDAFVSRQFDDDVGFLRLDFTARDLDGDAEWVRRVRAHRLAGRSAPRPAAAPPSPDPFPALKQRGNELFQRRDFGGALEAYDAALDAAGTADDRAAVESNRSACQLQLGDAAAALACAERCAALRPTWAKAHGRRGDALERLGRLAEARDAFTKALELGPGAPDIVARLERVSALLARRTQ